jgi:exopolyphosphatase/guanosine-5'-triphosphate,3'-diphosphate pyrophosphatase
MKCAAVDIGTNTVRLLIAELHEDGRLEPLLYRRAITRLGGGYKDSTGIDPASAERTVRALEDFRETVKEAGRAPGSGGVESVKAVATSVVRRARNSARFLREIRDRTGLDVSVISGEAEAALSLKGVHSVIDVGSKPLMVIDIGGGSTEFIVSKSGAFERAWSLEMGVVHLSEAYLKSDPPESTGLLAMASEIRGVIEEVAALMETEGVRPSPTSDGAVLAGTAGTVTTLAALDQDLKEYDRDAINGYTLKKERIADIYRRLAGMTLTERAAQPGLEKGREDLILPGAAITLSTMECFGFDSIKVSDAGLLEGILIS